MKALREIIRVMEDHKLNKFDQINIHLPEAGVNYIDRFIETTSENDFQEDMDATMALYGTTEQIGRYRTLLHRTKAKLYNNVLFLFNNKSGKATDFFYNYAALHRKMLVARFLFGVSAKTAAMELLESLISQAGKYELHNIVLQCAGMMRRQAMLNGNSRAFEKYNAILQQSLKLEAEELSAEESYYRVLLIISNSPVVDRNLTEVCTQSMEQLASLAAQNDTYNVAFFRHSVETLYYQMVGEYEKALVACDTFEDRLKQTPIFSSKTREANILTTRTNCHLHLGQTELGVENALKATGLYSEGSENWYAVQDLLFLLYTNSGRLTDATTLYLEATGNSKFNMQRQNLVETWKIYGGYLWFMLRHADDDANLERLSGRKNSFRFSKLFNEVPHYSRDKKGLNVAIILLQILLQLQQKDFPAVIGRMDALRSYLYRNLNSKEADYTRNNVFIRLMLLLNRKDFDRAAVEAAARPYLEALSGSRQKYGFTQNRLEIIPYEKLWALLLSLL